MTETQLYHGIHTNAYGGGGRGFRTLFLGAGGPSADAARVGRWLEALRPEGTVDGFAANCFRVGGVTYAALAQVKLGFAKDEHGREGGALVHALFSPLAEDRPPGDFNKALLDTARVFQRPDVEDTKRLDAYLAQCEAVTDLEIDPLNPAALLQVETSWLGALFAALTIRVSAGTQEMIIPVKECKLVDAVVQASTALPPRLRLGLRWGIGVRPASGLSFLARPGATPSGPSLGVMAAGGYLAWLLDRLRKGKVEDVRNVLESWEIRSWEGLLDTVAKGS